MKNSYAFFRLPFSIVFVQYGRTQLPPQLPPPWGCWTQELYFYHHNHMLTDQHFFLKSVTRCSMQFSIPSLYVSKGQISKAKNDNRSMERTNLSAFRRYQNSVELLIAKLFVLRSITNGAKFPTNSVRYLLMLRDVCEHSSVHNAHNTVTKCAVAI